VPASPVQVTIENISIDGCKIALGKWQLERGTTVLLELREESHVIGRVVWTRLNTAGIKFESQMSPAGFAAAVAGLCPSTGVTLAAPKHEDVDLRFRDRFGRSVGRLDGSRR
jgi:hypothetical protein